MTLSPELTAAYEDLIDALTLQDSITAKIQHAMNRIIVMDPGGAPGVTLYNQRDPKWAGVRLGTSTSTIGAEGCLITAYASALSDFWKPITPAEFNTWLNANNGYVQGNHFVFAAPDKLNVFKFEKLADYQKPAPMQELDDWLKAGNIVLVMVDFNPDPDLDQHWCRYLGAGMIMDPWYGDVASLTPRYRGKTPAEAIWRAAYYRRVT